MQLIGEVFLPLCKSAMPVVVMSCDSESVYESKEISDRYIDYLTEACDEVLRQIIEQDKERLTT